MAQTYLPKLRLTPPAGAQLTYDLSTYSYLTVIAPSWEPLFTEMEMLDRSVQQTRYGYRVTVSLSFEFPNSESANEAIMAQNIITKAMDDDWVFELSLDSGTTYRTVVLSQYRESRMGDKNIGLAIDTLWTCAAIVLLKPAVLTGGW
jgi:hypothetical protein